MAQKLYDLAVKTGEYQDRNSGQMKGRWENIGAVMQGNDGGKFIMLKRTFNPAGVPDLSGRGGDSVLASMFSPKNQQPAQQAAAPQQQAPAPEIIRQPQTQDDDIPF